MRKPFPKLPLGKKSKKTGLADRLTGMRKAGAFGKKPGRKTYGAGCD